MFCCPWRRIWASEQDLNNKFREKRTLDKNGILLMKSLFQLNAGGQPINGLVYDGRNRLLYRSEFTYDTAGRLHTKHNLMEELRKTSRVVAREDESAPHETFLVVDATTGSNGLKQAREFAKAIPISGVVVTKLDGSGKGGVVVAIKNELDLPARFIGTGEKATDFEMFESKRFVSEIL